MSLKLRLHPKPAYIILGAIVAVLAFFFIRTGIWELFYYHQQEGATRATAALTSTGETTAFVETPPSAKEVAAYFVEDGYPRYLSIPALGITNARILAGGVTTDDALATPINIYDTAWYTGSALPGKGGTAVINGHNGAGEKGVFKELNRLAIGDEVDIEVGGLSIPYRYRVVETTTVPLADSDDYMRLAFTSPVAGSESITLISCTGTWLEADRTYDHRLFVRAIRI